MANALFVTQNGHVLGTHSWVEGFAVLAAPRRPSGEDDILAQALYIARTCSQEEADDFLERELAKRPRAH